MAVERQSEIAVDFYHHPELVKSTASKMCVEADMSENVFADETETFFLNHSGSVRLIDSSEDEMPHLKVIAAPDFINNLKINIAELTGQSLEDNPNL